MLICVDMSRTKSRTDILGRRCSRVYNVVAVQCILSIILYIYIDKQCGRDTTKGDLKGIMTKIFF